MDAIKALKTRQSNRNFLPYSIDLEIIEDIIDCARHAPSARNLQPLHYVVVDDRKILDKFSEICVYGKFFKDAPIAIAVFSRATPFILEDASAATQNILLAAHAYNLGSCWVGSYKRDHSKEVEKMFNCDDKYQLVTMIAIGKVSEQTPRPPKKLLADIMSFNKFE